MTDNLYLIRLELTQEEGQALDALATRECRLTWEQARYLLRSQLIALGALVPDPGNPITAHMETR